MTLQWRHNGHDCVSNHQRLDCLRTGLFRPRSKKTSKFRVTGLCEGNSPVTGEFPAQRASNAEIVSIWWRHHELIMTNLNSIIWPGSGSLPTLLQMQHSSGNFILLNYSWTQWLPVSQKCFPWIPICTETLNIDLRWKTIFIFSHLGLIHCNTCFF